MKRYGLLFGIFVLVFYGLQKFIELKRLFVLSSYNYSYFSIGRGLFLFQCYKRKGTFF